MLEYKMIDAHCHIHYNNQEEILENSVKNGINYLLNIHEIENENDIFENFEKSNFNKLFNYKNPNIKVFQGAGVHPCGVDKISIEKAEKFLEILNDKIITFGETGLDLLKHDNKHKQIEFLEMHCSLAKKHNKPVVIHARNCEIMDILSIIKIYNVKTMFHCWTFGIKELELALSYDTIISFSGITTFEKAQNIKDSAKICPLDRMLIETDSPFLAPVPLRGKTNEPAFIIEIYKYISILKSLNFTNLEEIIENNFIKFFNINKNK